MSQGGGLVKRKAWWWLSVGSLLLLIILGNPIIANLLLERLPIAEGHAYPSLHRQLPFILSLMGLWALGSLIWVVTQKKSLFQLWNENQFWTFWTLLSAVLFHLLVTPVSPGDFRLLRMLWLTGIALLAVRLFWLAIVKPRQKGWKGSLSSAFLFVFIALLIFEGIFLFVARSHQTWETYAANIWRKRYWQENEQGFRDGAWGQKLSKKGKRVLVLGDSFTAGAGIAQTADRFPDRLSRKLGEGYEVFTLAYPGWGPERQLEALMEFPAKADLVILAWYVNDIHGALEQSGVSQDAFKKQGEKRKTAVFSLIDGSYLGNYLYWLYPHQEAHGNYMDFLRSGFSTPSVLGLHLDALDQIRVFCKQKEMDLAVVMFPLLRDVEGSSFAMEPVKQFWGQKDIPCLSLLPLLAKDASEDLVVNGNDAHPNERTHSRVAEALEAFLFSHNLLP